MRKVNYWNVSENFFLPCLTKPANVQVPSDRCRAYQHAAFFSEVKTPSWWVPYYQYFVIWNSLIYLGIVFSKFFHELLDYIADFFASRMVFNEKQKAKVIYTFAIIFWTLTRIISMRFLFSSGNCSIYGEIRCKEEGSIGPQQHLGTELLHPRESVTSHLTLSYLGGIGNLVLQGDWAIHFRNLLHSMLFFVAKIDKNLLHLQNKLNALQTVFNNNEKRTSIIYKFSRS